MYTFNKLLNVHTKLGFIIILIVVYTLNFYGIKNYPKQLSFPGELQVMKFRVCKLKSLK